MQQLGISGVYTQDGRMRPGCSIYLAIADFGASGRFVKAGYSRDPYRRLSSIQTGCPVPIKTLAYVLIPGDALARKIEGLLHRVYKPCRTSGEWFQFDLENPDHKKRWSGGLSAVLNEVIGHGKWQINYLDVAAAKAEQRAAGCEKAKATRTKRKARAKSRRLDYRLRRNTL